ncbi:MAG: glucose-6-phosphate 1-dehydrogenase [Urechidicola sp.]|jgi:glucose-6-phosphate 1-dehydrogenase
MSLSEKSLSTITPFDFVIFGGAGDLALRKIFPALYHRLLEGQLKKGTRIMAFSRGNMTTLQFQKLLQKNLKKYSDLYDAKAIKKFVDLVSYSHGDATTPDGYEDLKRWLDPLKNKVNVFYLATASSIFGAICSCLDHHGLISEGSRVVLEKPLGFDGASSEAINKEVNKFFEEKQIYRIDHYLGKETVQNLMVLRFANNLYEQAWNAHNIQDVQISVAESLGVGSRGDYYDKYGALRDMVQNHLLQLLCLIAMEPPTVLDAEEVRKEKLKVLKSLRLYDNKNINIATVKGQYGGIPKKKNGKSYLEDIGKKRSKTETFVALKTYVDNWRWAGVPFYLRTGKRMNEKISEIVITFKSIPHNIFPDQKEIQNNKLIIRLQPEEGIRLEQMIKVAGPGGYRYKPVTLKLDYNATYGGRFPGAYERLLMDVVRGNQTLFMSRKEVKASWKWIETISKGWEKTSQRNVIYKDNTADLGHQVLEKGHKWYNAETE